MSDGRPGIAEQKKYPRIRPAANDHPPVLERCACNRVGRTRFE